MKKLLVLFSLFLIGCGMRSAARPDESVIDTVMYEAPAPVEESPPMVAAPPPPPRERPREEASSIDRELPRAMPPAATNGGSPHTDTDDVNWVNESVDREISKMVEAHVLFDTPSDMTYQKPELISVMIYPPRLTAPVSTDRQESGTARITSRMEATLTGLGFAIASQTPEEQAVSGLTPTKWSWEVRPIERGDQYLNLSLLAIIEVEEEETRLVVKTFERKIPVTVTTGQVIRDFIAENWKWAWGALLIPLFGYLWRLKRGKKNDS